MSRSAILSIRVVGDAKPGIDSLTNTGKALDGVKSSADGAEGAVRRYGDSAANTTSKSASVASGIESVGDTAGRATTGLRDMADAVALAGFPEFAAGMTLAATGLEAVDGAANLYRATSEALTGVMKKAKAATTASTAATTTNTAATNTSKLSLIGHKAATVASTAATKVMTIAQKALNLAMKMNPIGLIVTAIAALVAGLVLAYNKSESFRNIVDKLWKILKNSLVAAFDAVSNAVSTVVGWFQSAWNWVQKLIDKIKNLKLPDWVPGVGGNIMVTHGMTMTANAGSPTAAAAAGTTVNVTFTGPVGDPHAVARELRRILRNDQARLGRQERGTL